MKLDWRSLLQRIDDMQLRERAMVFASLSLVVVVIAHVLLIDPALRRQKSLIERVTRDESQLKAIRGQLELSVKEGQARAQLPDEVAVRELERRIADAEKDMAKRQQIFVAPEQLPALLRELLGRSPRVQLESLQLQPGVPVHDVSVAPGAKPAAPPAPQAGAQLYRHGVELVVRGSYFDLLQYLLDLEKMPSRLIWGRVDLEVQQYPEVKLTVVVHTLSPKPSLLAL